MSEHAETKIETNLDTGTETAKSPSMHKINECIRLRLNTNLSLREIAEKTGLSVTQVGRILKGVKNTPEEPSQQTTIQEIPRTSTVAEPGIVVSQELFDDIGKNMPAGQKRVIDGWKRNVMRYNALLRQTRRHDGHASTGYSSNPFLDKMMQIMEAQTLAREMKGIMGSESNLTKHDIQTIIRNEVRQATQKDSAIDQAIKIVGLLRGSSENKSPTQIVAEVLGVTEAIKKISPQQTNWSVDDAIKWQENQARLQGEAQKTEMLTKTVEGVVKAIPTVVDKFLGKKGQTQTENGTSAKCPSCGEAFTVPSPVPIKIQCPNPNCKAILTRETESPEHTHTHEKEPATIGDQKTE